MIREGLLAVIAAGIEDCELHNRIRMKDRGLEIPPLNLNPKLIGVIWLILSEIGIQVKETIPMERDEGRRKTKKP